tara:strand:- start:933 stop:1406 length:474 start_codon:yes stop_codon:yes gene_type:complete
MVPAFTGLGAPYWDPQARGALFGLTRDTGINDLVRSALESVCYQTADLLKAMINDHVQAISTLRIDGGMAKNSWQMQFLADILNIPVQRPTTTETTALGAASLAALQVGIIGSLDELADRWQEDARFEPAMNDVERQTLLRRWQRAVKSTRTFSENR